MKTRIVTAADIAASPGFRLDADYYVDPTRKVDMQIAAAERTRSKATTRLASLKTKRSSILKEKGLETTEEDDAIQSQQNSD